MQNTLKFIDSLTNDTINKIRNSKSDAEARRILKETNAELLQSCVVGQSEQLQAIQDLIEFARNNARQWNDENLEKIIDRL